MSYRDEIKEYADACLEGLRVTLETPRVTALEASDVYAIYQQLFTLHSLAREVAAEKYKEEKLNS